MKFWDSSAVVALLVEERGSPAVRKLLSGDRDALVWALTPLEVLSALRRRRRQGEIGEAGRIEAERGLDVLERAWTRVSDLDLVERKARRLLAVHPLRAADAAQLAAALVACDDTPTLLPFVTLDDRLAEAARCEGFAVLP